MTLCLARLGTPCSRSILVEQIGELGAGALEAGRVDVGDVVGDDFQIGLLGVHAGGGDGECSHTFSSDRHAADSR
jgi:hypothetical protein